MAHTNNALVIIDEVHRLIEKNQIRFLLTGSSARKLRYNQANLLAGRARQAELFPLSYTEIPHFDLNRYLHYGGLPMIYQSDEPIDDLHAYVNTYLKEEIQAEALVRKLPSFTRFLKFAAITSGELVNFSHIASDAAIPASTAREYYAILEDTFLGFILPAWTKTIKRKPSTTARFYFFDLGVKNILANTMHYWRSKNGHKVDFIINETVAIEVKMTNHVQNKHLKGLMALKEENLCQRYFLISHDTVKRKQDNIDILPWNEFLNQVWNDSLF